MLNFSDLVEAISRLSRAERFAVFERLREEFEPIASEDLEWIREQLAPALAEEARGEFAPLDVDAIKRRGREILAREQAAK